MLFCCLKKEVSNITNLTLGSLFDGIGVFPLAAKRSDITPLWASEIEKAPISITKRKFPHMIHLGDLTKLHGDKIPPVDIITFGSPCQNLSTIGNREGLAGKKSNLYYEAIRIIEEMRNATNGTYPTLAIWENVMGAFSSNDRMDFKAVLESFTQTEIPIPPSHQWAHAGMVRGRHVDVCWRILDSQYWGVPQRRRRIFLVADFRNFRAREILFDTQGVQSTIESCHKNWVSSTKENLLLKQGGTYASIPSKSAECVRMQKKKIPKDSFPVSDNQLTLFPLY